VEGQGLQGLQGEQGPQGLADPQGEQRPQGEQGLPGPQGEQGPQGLQGFRRNRGGPTLANDAPQGLQGTWGKTGLPSPKRSHGAPTFDPPATLSYVRQTTKNAQQAVPQLFLEQSLSNTRNESSHQQVPRLESIYEQQLLSFRNLTERHIHSFCVETAQHSVFVRNKVSTVKRQAAALMPLEHFTYEKNAGKVKVARPTYIFSKCR
jgi:hypothetical protein